MPETPSLQQLIDRYNRRLLEYREQANASAPPTPEPVPRPQPKPEPVPRPQPVPMPNPPMPSPRPEPHPTPVPEPASLRVRVFTARQAIPIEGARVWISSVEPDGSLRLRSRVVTNADGLTRPVSLPAASMPGDALPSTPGASSPYIVEVWADEYLPASRRIDLIGGTSGELSVEMLPAAGSAEGRDANA